MHPGRTRWLPAALAAAVVVTASLAPADGSGTAAMLGVGADKWLHVTGYAVVAALTDAARRRPWPAVVAAVALLGFGVELAQIPLATRQFSLLDAAANAVGAALGVAAHRLAHVARTRAE